MSDNKRLQSMHSKAIRLGLSISLLVIVSLFISCGDDKLDIPNTPLEGTVAGEAWTFRYGAFRQFSATEFEFRFFSTREIADDPCALVTTSNPFLRVVIPANQSSISLPIAGDNFKQFKFDFGNGTTINATSGFIELFANDGFKLHGYVQAISDDDNMVEGRFELDPC